MPSPDVVRKSPRTRRPRAEVGTGEGPGPVREGRSVGTGRRVPVISRWGTDPPAGRGRAFCAGTPRRGCRRPSGPAPRRGTRRGRGRHPRAGARAERSSRTRHGHFHVEVEHVRTLTAAVEGRRAQPECGHRRRRVPRPLLHLLPRVLPAAERVVTALVARLGETASRVERRHRSQPARPPVEPLGQMVRIDPRPGGIHLAALLLGPRHRPHVPPTAIRSNRTGFPHPHRQSGPMALRRPVARPLSSEAQ